MKIATDVQANKTASSRAIVETEPSELVKDKWGKEVSYYSFNVVFGRPANIGIIGAAGFIGKFIKDHWPASEATLTGCTLSRDPIKAALQAKSLGLRADQVVDDYKKLLEDPRIDLIVVATDNASHFEFAKAALLAGKNVICEKPVAISSEQAEQLYALAEKLKLSFTLNHFYSQYSNVATLASLFRAPDDQRIIRIDPKDFPEDAFDPKQKAFKIKLGELEKISVEYKQDWVLKNLRAARQAPSGRALAPDLGIWRLMKEKQGPSCAYGDIGVHCLEVATAILGSLPTEVIEKSLVTEAEKHKFPLDVRAFALVKFANGVAVHTYASQIDQGFANDLTVKMKFAEGILTWSNRTANIITLKSFNLPPWAPENGVVLERGRPELAGLSADADVMASVVQGHDQGHGHAQSRLFRMALDSIARRGLVDAGHKTVGEAPYIPGAQFGVAEMKIMEAVAA